MQTEISILWDRAKKRKLISYTFYGDEEKIVKVEQQALRKDFSDEEKEILEARLGQNFIGVSYSIISGFITITNYIKFFVDRKLRELAYPDEHDPAIVYAPYITATTNTPTIGNYKADTSKMAKAGVYYQDTTIDSSSLQKFTMKVDYSKDSNNGEGKA